MFLWVGPIVRRTSNTKNVDELSNSNPNLLLSALHQGHKDLDLKLRANHIMQGLGSFQCLFYAILLMPASYLGLHFFGIQTSVRTNSKNSELSWAQQRGRTSAPHLWAQLSSIFAIFFNHLLLYVDKEQMWWHKLHIQILHYYPLKMAACMHRHLPNKSIGYYTEVNHWHNLSASVYSNC